MLVSPHHLRLTQRPDPREAPSSEEWVDLASNQLPVGPPEAVAAAAAAVTGELHRYPEVGSADLRGELARHLQVDRDRLVIGAGAGALVRDLLLAVCDPCDRRGNEVVFAAPAFDGYLDFIEDAHAKPVPVPLFRGRQDLDELFEAIDRNRCLAVVIANPHNPTGGPLSGEELEDFLDRVPTHVLVVLDEAYREFVTDPAYRDFPDGLRLNAGHPEREGNRPNVVVTRTWSKAYALGALRVGYLAADPVLAAMVAKRAIKYGVSRVAQAAAAATLTPAAQQEYRQAWAAVAQARDRMRTELHGLGYDVPDSQANFLWLRLGQHADAFARHCATHRIRVRAYPVQGVRVSIGLPQDNAVFMAAATTFADRRDRAPLTGDRQSREPQTGQAAGTRAGMCGEVGS